VQSDLYQEMVMSLRDEKRAYHAALQNTLGKTNDFCPHQRSKSFVFPGIRTQVRSGRKGNANHSRLQLASMPVTPREIENGLAQMRLLAEQREHELIASEKTREQLEQNMKKLEIERDGSTRVALHLCSNSRKQDLAALDFLQHHYQGSSMAGQ